MKTDHCQGNMAHILPNLVFSERKLNADSDDTYFHKKIVKDMLARSDLSPLPC